MEKSKRKPTIKDVALEAGTSIGTVSRVLNGHANVTEQSNRVVMDAILRLGYEPNFAAQTMRTQTKKAVGFLVNDISNPLFATIARHAETMLQEKGFSLILANSADRTGAEVELFNQLFRQRTDAIMMNMSDETNPALLLALKKADMPIVLMDREPVGTHFDRVMTDHAHGMRQATNYLIELGHKRIALVTSDNRISPGRARLDGFYAAHAAVGLSVDASLVRSRSLEAGHGFQEMFALWGREQRPTAVIAGGNQILLGVMRAIRQLEISIPNDLSLISCDETEVAELASPPITVIWRDLAQIGRTAADLLLQRLSHRGPVSEARRIILPTELLVRESCGPPPN